MRQATHSPMRHRWLGGALCAAVLILAAVLIHSLYRLIYAEAITAGRSLQFVQELEQLFPSSAHSISYFNEELSEGQWNSMVPLHDRYILEVNMMPFHVTKRAGRVRIIHHGSPRFELYDVESINVRPGGSIQYGRTVVRHFGIAEWERLVASGGDWSTIGVELRENDPIDGFDVLWGRLAD
jgi:hypothetical protein